MDVKDIIDLVEQSDSFKEWKSSHEKVFLAHIFFDDSYQTGYFNAETNKMVTFFVSNDVKRSEETDVFKKEGSVIQPLDMGTIKLTFEEALHKAKSFQEEQAGNEVVFKKFCILQHLDIGQVFNITFVTQSMKTFNIKISSETGELLSHHIDSLMDMTRQA